MNTNILVYSNRLAKQLLHQGFRIVDIEPNSKNKLSSVFYFQEEKGLKNIIDDYIKSKRERTNVS